jgi:hypothetical protein
LQFLAEIDSARNFIADGETVVSTGLDWIANEGFGKVFAGFDRDFPYDTSYEFRHRALTQAIRNLKF